MKKTGIDFFPYASANSVDVNTILAEYGAMGVYAYTILLQIIYNEKGYFFEASKRNISTLKFQNGIERENDVIEKVMEFALELGLFNQKMYKEYGIITSEEIQCNYFIAIRKRTNLVIEEKYLIGEGKEMYENMKEKKKDKEKNEEAEKVEKSEEKVKTAENFQKTAEKTAKVAENFDRKENIIKENKIGEKKIEEKSIEENSKKVFFERENRIGEKIIKEGNGEEDMVEEENGLKNKSLSKEEEQTKTIKEEKERFEDKGLCNVNVEAEAEGKEGNLSQKSKNNKNNEINLKSYEAEGDEELIGEFGIYDKKVCEKHLDKSVVVQDSTMLKEGEVEDIMRSGGYRKVSKDEIEEFKESFPNKRVKEVMYLVKEDFNVRKLIDEIKDSEFLKQLTNLSFDWFVKHYSDVMSGGYRQFKKEKKEKINIMEFLDNYKPKKSFFGYSDED